MKGLPARGIYGWDSTNETWVRIKVDSTGKITITSTDLTTILSEIQHATYGLSAIETLVDSIETTLASPDTFKADVSALALEATLTAIKGTSWSDETLKAIKDAVDAIDVSGVADAVWDEVASEHIAATSFGKLLADLVSESSSHPTLAEIEAGNLDQAISTTESNIRGGSETLESLMTAVGLIPTTMVGTDNAALASVLEDAMQKATSPSYNQDTDSLEAIREQVDLIPTTMVGTDNAALASVLEDAMQKATSPSFTQDTDSLEAIREALDIHDTDIKADVGDFSGQTHLQSLLAALGIPDTSGKSLYTCLITDRLDNATYGLSAIETLVDEIESMLKSGTYGLSIIETLVDEVESLLKNGTYGLSALETLVDGIETKTNNLPSDPADASVIAADFDRHLTKVDFWSITDDVIAIFATADQDYDLPDVTVPALPTGATIWKVYLLFKCSIIRDTSGSDNGIDENGSIRIKKDGDATFDGNGLTACTIYNNMWLVDVTNVGRDRGGDAFVGAINISSKVDGADTYNLRLDSISADGSILELHEVAVGLRVIFY